MPNYDQEIYNIAIEEGFNPIVAKIVVAQARLESGNYGSNVFNCNNNMFGMKYVGQPLATRGTLAPSNEISSGCQPTGEGCNRTGIGCVDRDFYAKYKSPAYSERDVIQRLYKINRNGIGFAELNASKDTTDYATKLKMRNYYGFASHTTPQGQEEIRKYAAGLTARLRLVNIIEFVKKNKKGIGLIVAAMVVYVLYVLRKEKKI